MRLNNAVDRLAYTGDIPTLTCCRYLRPCSIALTLSLWTALSLTGKQPVPRRILHALPRTAHTDPRDSLATIPATSSLPPDLTISRPICSRARRLAQLCSVE